MPSVQPSLRQGLQATHFRGAGVTQRRGRPTRAEEAATAYAQIEEGRRGGRGRLHRVLLPDGPLMIEFIRKFKAREHMAPTVQEIQDACRLSSTSVVHYTLCKLERDGALTRKPNTARSIVLAEEAA